MEHELNTTEVNAIAQMYNELTDEGKAVVSRLFGGDTKFTQVFNSEDLESFLKDNRFSDVDCPCCAHCGSVKFHKIGKVNGHQVFRCKNCGRKFRYSTNTIFQSAKLELSTYMKYVH
jgi:hypothetical protein